MSLVSEKITDSERWSDLSEITQLAIDWVSKQTCNFWPCHNHNQQWISYSLLNNLKSRGYKHLEIMFITRTVFLPRSHLLITPCVGKVWSLSCKGVWSFCSGPWSLRVTTFKVIFPELDLQSANPSTYSLYSLYEQQLIFGKMEHRKIKSI